MEDALHSTAVNILAAGPGISKTIFDVTEYKQQHYWFDCGQQRLENVKPTHLELSRGKEIPQKFFKLPFTTVSSHLMK